MSCNSQPFSFSTQLFFNNDCFSCADNGCGNQVQQAKCVIYTGPNLSCSGILTNDSLETVLQKIDEQICSAIGDYSTYQFNCLEDFWGSSITQESTFVDAITSFACSIKDDFNVFTGTTFPNYQDTIEARFVAIEVPGITCSSASVTNTDTLQTVLNKYCTKFTEIDTDLDISSVVWNNCFTVPSPPSNIAEGFTTVLSQICQLASASTTLPTFNNTANCLSGGTTDSLVTTIGLITTRLCDTPTFDIGDLTSSCVTLGSNITELLQNLIDKVDGFTQNAPSYSGDFSVSPNGGPCDGVTVSLVTPINQDRFVASNGSDSSPGTLIDKLSPGTNISLDDTTSPGTVIINASTTETYQVKANSGGTSPGYLDEKTEGGTSNGVTITTSYDSGTDKLAISPTVDISTLFDAIVTFVSGDGDALASLCSLIAPCIGASCQSYQVDNATGDTVNVTYTDCTTGLPVSVSLSNGGTIVVCAQFGTVSASGCTITSLGNCTGGGGGGGTTVRVTNSLGGTTVTNVTGISGFTLSTPVGTGGEATGTHNAFSGDITVAISGTPSPGPGNVSLYVNSVLAQCVDVSAAGNYNLSAGPYSPTDVIEIFVNLGGCS